MDLGLDGKVAVVTGASKGIGLAVTRALVQEGASVVAGARAVTDDLRALVADGYPVRPVAVDLTDPEGPGALVDQALTAFGGVDVLVNNVGAVRPRPGGFLSLSDDDWTWSLLTQLHGGGSVTRAAVPHLIERRRHDRDDVLRERVPARPAGHRLQRGEGRTGQLLQGAVEGARAPGVRVNTVSPGRCPPTCGSVTTAWPDRRPGHGQRPGCRRGAGGRRERHRPVHHAQEVADLVVLLASGRAGNVTGADFVIDGGLVQTL